MRGMRRHRLSAVVALLSLVVFTFASSNDPSPHASWTVAATVGAPEAWAAGLTGEGIGIALVDTGVSPRPQLHDAVSLRVDTAGPSQVTDGHGHGTFLAGLMAASAGPNGPVGVAPGAHVVSFKVADGNGNTTLERVLAGLGAVRVLADELNIRVVVVALGGPADDMPDPLEQALEDLWAAGLLVVVASGNQPGLVAEPGVSPYLLTVGATNDGGTADRSDDVVAPWSGSGLGRDGLRKPDVHAPGASVVSVRVPGSLADQEHPESRIGSHWFRGSGTSMAAAVTAGAAALVLEADPTLGPDEVKGRLMASSVVGPDNPSGTIHVPSAVASTAVANTHLPPLAATETTSRPADPVDLPVRIIGSDDVTWDGSSWVGSSWVGSSWVELSWDGSSWVGSSWVGSSWVGSSWVGSSWTGSSWVGSSWTGSSWTGSSWTGSSWS